MPNRTSSEKIYFISKRIAKTTEFHKNNSWNNLHVCIRRYMLLCVIWGIIWNPNETDLKRKRNNCYPYFTCERKHAMWIIYNGCRQTHKDMSFSTTKMLWYHSLHFPLADAFIQSDLHCIQVLEAVTVMMRRAPVIAAAPLVSHAHGACHLGDNQTGSAALSRAEIATKRIMQIIIFSLSQLFCLKLCYYSINLY